MLIARTQKNLNFFYLSINEWTHNTLYSWGVTKGRYQGWGAGAGCFWLLGAGAAWKKSRSRSCLEKKSGAGAAKKLAGSSALRKKQDAHKNIMGRNGFWQIFLFLPNFWVKTADFREKNSAFIALTLLCLGFFPSYLINYEVGQILGSM